MAYAAVVTLRLIIENYLFNTRPCFRPPCLNLLELAQKEIKSFEEFLKKLDSNGRKRMSASLRRIQEAVRTFQDVFVSHFLDQMYVQRADAEKGELFAFEAESLEQEFHAIFKMLREIKRDADYGGKKLKMVGLSDVYDGLKQEVVVERSQNKLQFFAIVGMAGVGKTALAEAVFDDLDVSEWFECRVWVSVGKNCQLDDITRRILTHLSPGRARKLAGGDGDMGTYLEEVLEGKRWLVVLDDVWDARVCGYLESFLPNDGGESRVILTSRSRRVAEHAAFVSEMRLLNEKESWVLLREKLFGGRCCPPEVEKIGKKIAEKCEGLPLTIITVANLLLKIPESVWIDVATKRKHQVFIDAYDEISKVLYPSYEDIPQHLKFCFLYMAVFPSNYKIPRSRLINMWFVEGLLEFNTAKSSEDCADECLDEFSSNSLVMVYQKRRKSSLLWSIEETKSCGLHSSWWHLCYKEARKNNFFYVLISREDRLAKGAKSQSRLSIHNNILFAIEDVYSSIEKNSASTACSLLCLGPYHPYPVPICFGLKLLKNLDAINIRFYEFPLEVLELGGLKYFTLSCDGMLPASISKLQNLQFFILNRHHNIKLHGTSSYLPVEIWDMSELKHFQIMGSDMPDDHCGTILPNLTTLLDVSDQSCTKGIFERIPHLRKLGIRIELILDATQTLCCFDHIFQLNELEILKCVVANPAECKFESISQSNSLSIFPLGLKKLTLSGFGYPWEEMSKIASLPRLEVLKLRCNAFRGPMWEMKENEFPMLTFLEIEDIDLMEWNVGRGTFEVLEFISINHCYKLKELHWEFDVELISKIELIDCNPSLENTIRGALLRKGHIPDNISVHSSWEAKEDLKP